MEYASLKLTSYTQGELYTLMYERAHKNEYVVYIRGEYCKNEDLFFHDLAVAFRFPFYFGNNWDALDECICDLEWISFDKILLVIENYRHLFEEEKECMDICLKHLNLATRYWAEQDVEFEVLLNEEQRQVYY